MADWTDPSTVVWVPDDIPTAAQMNAFLQQNPLFLYEAFEGEMVQTMVAKVNANPLVANEATLSKLVVPREIAVAAVRFRTTVTDAGSNVDVGIYSNSYARLWSRGSFTCPGAGSSTVSISGGSPTTLTLTPGAYWFAMACTGTTAEFAGDEQPVTGMSVTKTASFPLPDPISGPSTNTTKLAPWAVLSQ